MFAKRLFEKAIHSPSQGDAQHDNSVWKDLDLRVYVHYGVPSTASILAFDPIQRLLAIGTLDGRIKVIGGDGIEGLFVSPRQVPIKHLEFLRNQGILVSISNDNYIQVWNLESRSLASCLQWESNVTAFSVIAGSNFIYVGDEHGLLSVLKCDAESGELCQLPYHIPATSISKVLEISFPDDHHPIVGVLHQPCLSGDRVLIAYECGLLILWDVSKGRILFTGGGKDLCLKDGSFSSAFKKDNLSEDTSGYYLGEKEISALCWASCDGSIAAVGYVDGDILFWKTSSSSVDKAPGANLPSSDVVRLRLSSEERRLPVIVLQWFPTKKSHNYNGLLFAYGGDQIGADEVLTVLNLEWSSGAETLRCIGRVDLTLAGSFADMILLPSVGAGGNLSVDLLLLTCPGQLHFFDDSYLSTLMSQHERKPSVSALEFPTVIPARNPLLTSARLYKLPECSSKDLSKISAVAKPVTSVNGISDWPLTGGVPCQISNIEESVIGRVYIAGYQDGSVRMWDATHPILSSIFTLEGQVQGIQVAGLTAAVSSLDLCVFTLNLAVGNESGLVLIYNLKSGTTDKNFHFITDYRHEVHPLLSEAACQCKAVFSLFSSPVQVLQFVNHASKLAVGFQSGQVAVLDMGPLSVLFCSDCSCGSLSPVISIYWRSSGNIDNTLKSQKIAEVNMPMDRIDESVFVLTKDAKILIIAGGTGNRISSRPLLLKKKSTPIAMYVIDDNISVSSELSTKDTSSRKDATTEGTVAKDLHETAHLKSAKDACSAGRLLDSLLLLCYEDSLRLYSTKSVIQGNHKTSRKVKHAKPCCWTSTLRKDGKVRGLVVLYQTGDLEIRSLPDLALVKVSSLMAILRWKFQANMDKMMASDGSQIALANGCELALISLEDGEDDLRALGALPCLHDQVLAAAADTALTFSTQKKKQASAPGILRGIVKGFKMREAANNGKHAATSKSGVTHLGDVFSKSPFADQLPTLGNNQEIVDASSRTNDQEEELSIDDIDIDDLAPTTSNSICKPQNKDNRMERDKLFDGATDVTEPRLRTPEEIIAKYRKRDPAAVAEQARNKLLERQAKLERINQRTAELQSGAEDFASLANELVKVMESRKWWHI
ncbi:uncharacterized protein LOC115745765 isoform X2 [Rhodamnia argentea]|uniref:Uncharacterized protein LOC115745765 isoform X2 n=1 Tax=Rhodamnia argentea TaxID=178133 RepID=A0A8B8PSH8_9MYRT|nr:uncharacterized protein LOC115745765 isoform X2 [Rhodamnia argentea]